MKMGACILPEGHPQGSEMIALQAFYFVPSGIFVRPPRKKIAKRQLELRNRLWPDIPQDWLWSRHTHDGFTTLPKAMPLMMSIMDDLAKGQPVSSTYLELWCRTFDENFVTLSKPREIAFHSGFFGQRAERTWRARLKILSDLHFRKAPLVPPAMR
jgi:hypothetical protein